ncbi:hypothetical protein [Deinococcus sp.]|uniref:hypothetical protein n=1 Tax=Deinococcus sp. TaxID=47478 RepID=UPI003C7A863C
MFSAARLTGPLAHLGDAPSRSRLLSALRRIYLLGLLALMLPGLLIGLPLGLFSSPQPGVAVLLGLSLAALLCAALALTLAHRKARAATAGTREGRDLALQAAIQAASAPAAPLLMALAMFRTPLTAATLLALTLLALGAGWASLHLWASRAGLPEQARPDRGGAAPTQPSRAENT